MRDLYAVVQASDTLDSEELKKNSTIVEILQNVQRSTRINQLFVFSHI